MPQEWTPGMRKQWEETWLQPHMRLGLEELKERVRKKPMLLLQGYDALVLAAGEHHRSVGHQEIFDHIEEMGREKREVKQLSAQPWSQEARGVKPPEQESQQS